MGWTITGPVICLGDNEKPIDSMFYTWLPTDDTISQRLASFGYLIRIDGKCYVLTEDAESNQLEAAAPGRSRNHARRMQLARILKLDENTSWDDLFYVVEKHFDILQCQWEEQPKEGRRTTEEWRDPKEGRKY